MDNQASKEMPKYRCIKEVHALQIAAIENKPEDGISVLTVAEEGFEPITVDSDWRYKHEPYVGGYYVVYKDGYTSFSPEEAFAEGYMRI